MHSHARAALVVALVLAVLGAGWLAVIPQATAVDHVGGIGTQASHAYKTTVITTRPAAPAARATPPAAVHPAVPGNLSVSVSFTSALPLFSEPGFNVPFQVSVVNGTISPTNTSISVQIKDLGVVWPAGPFGATSCNSEFVGFDCPTVANISLNSSVATGKTTYNITANATNLNSLDYKNWFGDAFGLVANLGVFPDHEYLIVPWVNQSGYLDGVPGYITTAASAPVWIIVQPLFGSFSAPLAGSDVTAGNITIGVLYGGNYLESATVTITSGTTTVYRSGVYNPAVTTGNVTVVSPIPWLVSTPGVYNASLQLQAEYTTAYFNTTFTVLSGSAGTVFYNSTTYHNTSLLSGLTSGTAGTILLVLGLIVGMIVALAVARSMWGSPRQAPPQQWQGTQTAAAGANTCSVCGKSFDSADALSAHAKAEHGIE